MHAQQINCPNTTPPIIAQPANSTACTGQQVVSTVTDPGIGLPTLEYIVTDPNTPATDGWGDLILGGVPSGAFDPAAEFGLMAGDEFCVTAVNYDLSQVQGLLDGILTGSAIPLGACCNWVDLAFPGLCTNLNAGGINSGSDIQNLNDVFALVGQFNPGATFSIQGFLFEIDSINTDAGILPAACGSSFLDICYASDVSQQACYTVAAGPMVTATTNQQIICPGASATLIASGGTAYTWSDGQTGASISVSPTMTTTYSVSVSDACGTASDEVTIIVDAAPLVNAGLDQTTCSGAAVMLTATGTGTFSWSNGMTGSTITVAPTATTTYTVTASTTCGTITDDVTVDVTPLPVANAGMDQTICPGGSASLTASGGATYLWSDGQTTASIMVSPAATTTYTVTVTDACGSATDEVTVTVSSTVNANAGMDQAICNGGSAMLTASGGGTYLWSDGQTSASITVFPIATTTYSVTVTGSCGAATDEVTVMVNNNIIANAGPDETICAGGSATLTASGGATYAWSNGMMGASVSVSPAATTTYTVTVTDICGTATDDLIVEVLSAPNANAGADQSVCGGTTVMLTASGGGTYSWSNGMTGASIMVSPTASTTYTVTVMDVCGTSTDDVTVNVAPPPSANAGADQSTCAGQAVTLTASGGTAYQWSDGQSGATVSVAPNATTTYTVTVTNACGSDTDDVTVNVTTNVMIDAGMDVIVCQGEEVTLTASGGDTYIWNNGQTGASLTVTPNSSISYTVTGFLGGCTGVDNVTITVIPAPIIEAGANQTICEGESTMLTAIPSTAGTFEWSTGETTATISVMPSGTETYSITFTDDNGCVDTDEVSVSNFTTAQPTISESGGVLTADINAFGYQWYLNGQPIQGASAQSYIPVMDGDYTVEIFDTNGCSSLSDVFAVDFVAIEDIEGLSVFEVYPNPFNGYLTVQLESTQSTQLQLELVNITGQVLFTQFVNSNDNAVLDLRDLSAGMYFIRLSDAAGSAVRKVTKFRQ